ncbi:hypothetical protein GJW-30_1_02571 [Variibacter gotjawalensis]|uniref:Uncharacterized protein n=1 Tax=Variibacter gotjawalensis TaxID=1333996 RepID=A0A0S3PVY7_9BRAD|nr:hypothetical protein [Variibacter gotjawalensis]NIK45859.1 hypothetical protein [Variibacter gotjawalensis]RZS47782.1 hypothetical protein EV661_0175 [Variibacter gotjawalensis]BAT60036.1 hypothetical protein GJW-30_1_02571 [Variibacter gotjawalensis]
MGGMLSGQVAMIVLIAVPIALFLSILLQWIYLRSVKRSMMHSEGAMPPADPHDPPPSAPLAPLGFATDLWSLDLPPSTAKSLRRRAALVYIAGGIVYGAVLTLFYLAALGQATEIFRFRTPLLIGVFAFPLVLTLAVTITVSWRELCGIVFIYAVAMTLIYIPQLMVGADWSAFFTLFFLFNLPGLVLATIFLLPRVRTVGPLVLGLTLAAVAGALLSNHALFYENPERLMAFVKFGTSIGLGGLQLYYSVMAIGALLLGIAGWLVMRLVGKLYRDRRISDQTMIADSIWLIFSVVHASSMIHSGVQYFFAPFIAFAAGRMTIAAGFLFLRARYGVAEKVPNLLLLRVFSLGRRSSRLFNKVSRLWRYRGSIHMIAGPDLASTTVEPHEFLGFLSGRLARRFIADDRSFQRRLSEVEQRLDLDGRYRVGDFFCHDNAWRMVLTRLARRADVILMDLRGFTPKHQGCVFEIREIVNRIPFARVVFVIDGTTDEPFLRKTFTEAWVDVPASSPNVAAQRDVTLFRLGDGQTSDVKALVRLLEALSRSETMPEQSSVRYAPA